MIGGQAFVTVSKRGFGRGSGRLTWRDSNTGKLSPPGEVRAEEYVLTGISVDPSGRRVAVGGHNGRQTWNADGGKSQYLRHRNYVEDLAFSPDGRALLSASWDQKACLWSIPDGQLLSAPLPHSTQVQRCAFATDNVHFMTGQRDGLVRIWQRGPSSDPLIQSENEMWGEFPRVSEDGSLVTPGIWHNPVYGYTGFKKRPIRVLDASTGVPVGPTINVRGALIDSAICDGGELVAVLSLEGNSQGWLSVWEISTGTIRFEMKLAGSPVSIAPRPGSLQVAALFKDGSIIVCDCQDGTLDTQLKFRGWDNFFARCPRVEYSPDGQTMVALTASNAIQVVDPETGKNRFAEISPVLESGYCSGFTISPDGQHLATMVKGNNAVQIWNLESGKAETAALRHRGDDHGLRVVEFTPDGKRLVTASLDQVRVWNWKTGEMVCPVLQHEDDVLSLSITGDSRFAMTVQREGSGRREIHCWSLATGMPMCPPIETDSKCVVVSRGLLGFAAYGQGPLTVLDAQRLLSQPTKSAQALFQLGSLASGSTIRAGATSKLTRSDWEQRWTAIREDESLFRRPSQADLVNRHRRAATLMLDSRNSAKARAHLDRALALAETAVLEESKRDRIRDELRQQRHAADVRELGGSR